MARDGPNWRKHARSTSPTVLARILLLEAANY